MTKIPDDGYVPMSPERMARTMSSVNLMTALYGTTKIYIECHEKDKQFEVDGRPVKELDVKPGVEWQKRRVKLVILKWFHLNPAGTNEQLREFIFSDQFDKYGI